MHTPVYIENNRECHCVQVFFVLIHNIMHWEREEIDLRSLLARVLEK